MRLSGLLQGFVLLVATACGAGLPPEGEESQQERTLETVPDPTTQYALAYVDWVNLRPALALSALAPDQTRVVASTVGGLVGSSQFTVSPDGKRLAFLSFVGADWHLFVLELETGVVTPLVSIDGGTLAGQPRWRADGLELAYVSFNGLPNQWDVGVVDLAGAKQVVATVQVPDASYVTCIRPAWSRTGTRLAFGAFSGTELEGVLGVIDRASGTTLTTYNPEGAGEVCHPEWAPDDSALVVTERSGTPLKRQLVQVSADLATATPLRAVSGHGWPQAQWSPDGASLAFVDADLPGLDASLYSLRLSDGQLTPLATLGAGMEAGHPQWSPDGSQLAYVDHGDVERAARLRVIPAAGGEASTIVLLKTGIRAGHPVWLPEPTTYTFEAVDLTKVTLTPK